jgi:hypothetical protein
VGARWEEVPLPGLGLAVVDKSLILIAQLLIVSLQLLLIGTTLNDVEAAITGGGISTGWEWDKAGQGLMLGHVEVGNGLHLGRVHVEEDSAVRWVHAQQLSTCKRQTLDIPVTVYD